MKLIKRNTDLYGRNVGEFGGALSDLFSRFFHDDDFATELDKTAWNPRVDILEKGGELVVKADLPGIEEKDLNVEIRDNILTISGRKEEEKEVKDGTARRIERFAGSFSRSFTLPVGAQGEKIAAEYRKGVLTVKIPSAGRKNERKEIPVRVS